MNKSGGWLWLNSGKGCFCCALRPCWSDGRQHIVYHQRFVLAATISSDHPGMARKWCCCFSVMQMLMTTHDRIAESDDVNDEIVSLNFHSVFVRGAQEMPWICDIQVSWRWQGSWFRCKYSHCSFLRPKCAKSGQPSENLAGFIKGLRWMAVTTDIVPKITNTKGQIRQKRGTTEKRNVYLMQIQSCFFAK